MLAEVIVALHDPAIERHALDRHYDPIPTYVRNQDAGLYPFEARAVDRFFPRPPARILVPGMGGGREVVALARRGFAVDGFDPVPRYVAAARAAAATFPVRVDQATLQAWAARATGHYDGILTGWGLWTHMLTQADRLAALRAFRATCPSGPVLLSFYRGEDAFDHEERATPLEPLHPTARHPVERAIRGFFRERVLRRPPLERGTGFFNGVYFHRTTEAELEDEASQCGLRVAYYERDGSKFPHAVLRPADAP